MTLVLAVPARNTRSVMERNIMIWQDLVFGIGTIIFSIALIPAILGKEKPPVSTSLSTGVTVLVVAFTQASLSLWFASAMSMISGFLWLTLAIQKYHRIKYGSR